MSNTFRNINHYKVSFITVQGLLVNSIRHLKKDYCLHIEQISSGRWPHHLLQNIEKNVTCNPDIGKFVDIVSRVK